MSLTSLRSTDAGVPLGGSHTDMGLRAVVYRWFGFREDRDVVRARLADELGAPSHEHGGMVIWRHAHGGGIERTVTVEGRRRGFAWGFDESFLRDEVVTVVSLMVTAPLDVSTAPPPSVPPPAPPSPSPLGPDALRSLLGVAPATVHLTLAHLPAGPRLDVEVDRSGAMTRDDSIVPPTRSRLDPDAHARLWSLVDDAVRHVVEQRLAPPQPPRPPAPGDSFPTVDVTWPDGTHLSLLGRDDRVRALADEMLHLSD